MTHPSKTKYSIPKPQNLSAKPKQGLDIFQNSLIASDPMTPKPNWIFRQSAVIPYRKENDRIEIILITSRSSKHWIFPKGIIEPNMTPESSAAKEALEEAGVIGKSSSTLISEYEYKKWGGFCNVQVYP